MTNGIRSETNGIPSEVTLLPCPLCGGEAMIRKSIWFYVQCTTCPLELGASYDGDGNPDGEYWTEGDAVAAWNRRAAEAELVELAHSAWSMALCAMQGMPIPAEWGERVENGLRNLFYL